MQFEYIPNDVIREIIKYLPLDNLINFNLVNSRYKQIVKETPWYHLVVTNFRYFVAGYHFSECSVRIDADDRLNSDAMRLLSKCSSVELTNTIVDSLIIKSLKQVRKLKFSRCFFDLESHADILHIANAESISLDHCGHFPLEYIPRLSVKYYCSGSINNYVLRYLGNVKRLESSGYSNGISDAGLKYLTNVKELTINMAPYVTNKGISHLHSIQKLNVSSISEITNGCFANLTNGVKLNILNCKNINPDGPFGSFSQVQVNDWMSADHTGSKTRPYFYDTAEMDLDTFVDKFSDAYDLLIDNNTITNDHIQRFTNINVLHLYACLEVTDRTLYFFRNVNKLKLSFIGGITNDGLAHLSNLQILKLRVCINITDGGIKYLSKISQLKLDNIRITNNGLSHLKNTRYLSLSNCTNITDEGFVHLTNVWKLRLDGDQIGDNGLRHLVNVRSLCLRWNHQITDNGINFLSNVRHLQLHKTSGITNKGITNLTNLISLYASSCEKITDEIFFFHLIRIDMITLAPKWYVRINPIRKAELEEKFSEIIIETSQNKSSYDFYQLASKN